MARPVDIDLGTVERIEAACLVRGATRADVAEAAGISRATLFNWMAAGAAESAADLFRRVHLAGQLADTRAQKRKGQRRAAWRR